MESLPLMRNSSWRIGVNYDGRLSLFLETHNPPVPAVPAAPALYRHPFTMAQERNSTVIESLPIVVPPVNEITRMDEESNGSESDNIMDEFDEIWEENEEDSASEKGSSSFSNITCCHSSEETLLHIGDSSIHSDLKDMFSCGEGSLSEDGSGSFGLDSDDDSSISSVKNFAARLTKTPNDDEPKQPSWESLRASMKRSRLTQEMLQEHDRKQGLPRSHCVTMMHTNRSRLQLEEGRILPKWNGKPLITKKNEIDEGKGKKQTTARAA